MDSTARRAEHDKRGTRPRRPRHRRGRLLAAAIAAALGCWTAAIAGARAQSAPSGQIHAVIVGVEAYRRIAPASGAASDAKDIGAALQDQGVRDLTLFLDSAARRDDVLSGLRGAAARASKGDWVVFAFAGMGSVLAEKAERRGVFLLSDFDAADTGRENAIGWDEIAALAQDLDRRGVRTLLLFDFSAGGPMERAVDPRGGPLRQRFFERSAASRIEWPALPSGVILLAADGRLGAPEVRIPGEGWRGALSYAVARAIEGAADHDGDGHVTAREFADFTTDLSYQLSDQRQFLRVDGAIAPTDILPFQPRRTRGIAVQAVGAPAPAKPAAGSSLQIGAPAAAIAPAASPSPSPSLRLLPPIRVAATDGAIGAVQNFVLPVPYVAVAKADAPDVLWDPATGEAVSGSDVIAHGIDQTTLPGVIERIWAANWLKMRAARGLQPIRVYPSNQVQRKGTRVEIEVANVAGRSLLVFNMAGDGTVQLIHPIGKETPPQAEPAFRVQLQVSDPLGADQIVAISALRPMPEIEQALRAANRRRSPSKIIEALDKSLPADALVGTASLFTGP